MKIVHKLITFFIAVVIISTFGLFIYPGLYKYDKLNQKYPVKINRLTGSTQILTQKGWQNADNYNAAKNEMLEYKQEISEQIMNQNENIKQEVLADIKDQLEQAKKDVITETNNSRSKYDSLRETMGIGTIGEQNTPNGTFSKGDSTDKVQEVMGVADSVTEAGPYETWMYGTSMVKFKDGKVTGWNNAGNLAIK